MDQGGDGEEGATVSWEDDGWSKAQSSQQEHRPHSSAPEPQPTQVLSSFTSTWLFCCCRSSIDNVTSGDGSSEAMCLNDSQSSSEASPAACDDVSLNQLVSELKDWLKEILDELDARDLERFHCYLQTADELKDGFKPVKKTRLEHADKSYTVDLMVRTYSTKTREVTEAILKKINSDKENSLHDDDDEEDKPDFSTPAPERLLDSIRSQFVEKVPEVILYQLLDALVSDGVFNHLEKEEILEGNQTRANKARAFIDSVRNKGGEASWKMIVELQKKDKNLSSQLGLSSGSSVLRAALAKCQPTLRFNLMERFQCVYEGIAKAGNTALLDDIYTELYITEGGTGDINCEHEVRQIETTSRRPDGTDKKIRQEDIFKPPPGRKGPIRRVMTKGVAGIGKTVLTQKFTLDWAEEKSNQDIHFLFPFTFRELNGLKEENLSLVELVHEFFNEMTEIHDLERFRVVFIFDGLDECRLPLDFSKTKILTDPRKSTSVGVLLTNLIRGKLLPSARVWITTRPAAANQIPPDCIHLVTEVRGFTDPQKEEYFRKRFRDEEQSSRIISHIKTSRSLHIMCHIPVFCWITATVLEDVLNTRKGGELPKTLTEMYIHFLVVQAKVKKVKYDGGTETDPHWSPESKKMMESLGKLAFEQLQKGNLIFYEEDLTECGIDIREASVYSGVLTEVFREESRLYQDKVFCFIHLSVQEFLAALHVHLTFINSGVNLLEDEQQTTFQKPESRKETCFYQTSVDKALQSPNGHLDLFLRFLLGLSLQNNQTLLRGLLKPKGRHTEDIQQTVEYIKKKISENLSAEKSINLFHCLNELNNRSLVEEIQQLSGCLITEEGYTSLVSALRSNPSHLRQLDLSYNHLGESALKPFITGEEDPTWRLEALRLEPSGERWLKPGLRKYSGELTINMNTVNKNIKLSNNSRRMTFVDKVQSYPDHPDRFDDDCLQLLCKDHLPDRCYWEAEWTGNASLSVSYRGISRRGDKKDCVFGRNHQSWTLNCYDRGMYVVCHNDSTTLLNCSISNRTDRIAVYLDRPAGTLTYYKVTSGGRLHIHTFSTTFTEPLYAGFRVWPNSSVSLCWV